MTNRRASCAGGQLTATTTGDPVRVSICHCLECQKRRGKHAWIGLPERMEHEP